MKLSSLTFFLLISSFYSAGVLASPENYKDIDEKISNLEKKYMTKIRNLPPEILQDKFSLADIGKYGDLLESNWKKVTIDIKSHAEELDGLFALNIKLYKNGALSDTEVKKLQSKIQKEISRVTGHFMVQERKYNSLRKRLVKNYSVTEFAEYLKSLKLPGACKIEDIKEENGILTISVSREEDGKILRQQGTLNFNNVKNLVANSSHDPDHGEIITHFQDIDFDAQTEQSKIKVYQYPNGAVSLFSFQSFNKKEYLAKIPIIGINIFERKSDPFINCSTNEHSRDLDNTNNTARGAIKGSEPVSDSRSRDSEIKER